MAPTCSVCQLPDRQRIDRELARGAALKPLAAQSGVSADCLRRHRAHHLPLQLVRQQVLADARDTLDVGRLLHVANAAAVQVLADARQSGRPELVLRAVDRIVATLLLQVRIAEGADAAALQERLVALEERLAGFGARPASTRLPGGPGWPRTAT